MAEAVEHHITASGTDGWICSCGVTKTTITGASARRESYQHVEAEKDKVRPQLLRELQRAIQPAYDGWEDQYKAILNVLGIDLDMSIAEVRNHTKWWRFGR